VYLRIIGTITLNIYWSRRNLQTLYDLKSNKQTIVFATRKIIPYNFKF
jgi:hypothetical protein